ncbi:MAG TPA: 5-amino-6-(D-ribitylamino)uracil--L-tyrosine 4-hydroxyphenyl transferase CofH [Acidimicrobiia bacterium]|nr:5-amino-6-(D-ribitylamino)uracil--L-tyrosine 4-hydroxyphenyl transferase CofH [Acidimicrobiia bacterium]
MTITFCRVRPASEVTELSAVTRRREGTTTLEMIGVRGDDRAAALAGGILPVETAGTDGSPAAWVVAPEQAVRLAELGVAGWRITVLDEGARSVVLDGVARSRAAFLRTGRSNVAAAASLAALPGVETSVSVFVDTVDDAVRAVEEGASDLLLRDWGMERIGELRDALGALIERPAFPIDLDLDSVRRELSDDLFTTWLNQIDGRGAVRPRYEWAPGKDQRVPLPARRFSAQWADAAWVGAAGPEGLEGAGALRPILERSLEGHRPTRDELEMLFHARGAQVDAVGFTADTLRQQTAGETVTYVVNRNINYTNLCYFRCGFCAFSKGPRSLNLRGEPYSMTVEQIVHLAESAVARGATEVTLQGGIHPDYTGDFYVAVVEAIKERLPHVHIHGFTPLEVWQGAETLGSDLRDYLVRLRHAGLGTLPGTAAEILDDRVRAHLCPDKITTAEWAEVMLTAHEVGLRATATVMFGHIDGPASWANHYEVVGEIQKRTGGFTEFVPLPFVHMGSPIWLRGRARPGPTWDEVVLIHALARIAFDGLIPNIQASWVKLGLDGVGRLLNAGANDIGGTLMGEIITRAAGASHGEEMTSEQFETVIREAGRTPSQRTTLYEVVERT